jgi:hypothetical protein
VLDASTSTNILKVLGNEPLPFSFSVSMLPPPSTRARLPAPVRCNATMLLALIAIVSLHAGKSYVVFGKTDTNAIDLTVGFTEDDIGFTCV